jgi:hypothetical protein
VLSSLHCHGWVPPAAWLWMSCGRRGRRQAMPGMLACLNAPECMVCSKARGCTPGPCLGSDPSPDTETGAVSS